jgi:glycosyltransferase involved in cell wall biosynthesis
LADPEAGICVRSMQWAELEAAVVALLSTPGWPGMGERGFAYGRKRFTAERMAADYLKLYRRLGA